MSSKKIAEIVETLVKALNKRKRQSLNKVESSRSSKWYKAMAKELNAKSFDSVATNKSSQVHSRFLQLSWCFNSRLKSFRSQPAYALLQTVNTRRYS